MAVLLHMDGGARHVLGATHLVGRSRSCRLRLEGAWVSSEHASMRWTTSGWQLRDLGSRNGTWVEGRRLEPGLGIKLIQGMRVGFGQREASFELVDAGPPEPRASAQGGEVFGEDGLLLLPSAEQPLACVHEGDHGLWVLEEGDHEEIVRDGQIVSVGGSSFELELPTLLEETGDARVVSTAPRLELRVSQDEEHIEVDLCRAESRHELGHRAFSELLLLLARKRLEDGAAGAVEAEQGWVYADELAQGLGLDRCQFNMAVFRARQAVKRLELGVELFERRRGSGQLRLALEEVVVSGF